MNCALLNGNEEETVNKINCLKSFNKINKSKYFVILIFDVIPPALSITSVCESTDRNTCMESVKGHRRSFGNDSKFGFVLCTPIR